MTCSKSALFIPVFLLLMNAVFVLSDECRESRCSSYGPPIRFPFRLVDETNDHCGYPGFDLSCDEFDETILVLPTVSGPLKLHVRDISYRSQEVISLYGYWKEDCPNKQLVNLNDLRNSPFQIKPIEPETANITFFNCSSSKYRYGYREAYMERRGKTSSKTCDETRLD